MKKGRRMERLAGVYERDAALSGGMGAAPFSFDYTRICDMILNKEWIRLEKKAGTPARLCTDRRRPEGNVGKHLSGEGKETG